MDRRPLTANRPDTLLDEFFSPFQNGIPDGDIAHLLAINDGRLLEWIESYEKRHDGPTPLTTQLADILENDLSEQEGHVRTNQF